MPRFTIIYPEGAESAATIPHAAYTNPYLIITVFHVDPPALLHTPLFHLLCYEITFIIFAHVIIHFAARLFAGAFFHKHDTRYAQRGTRVAHEALLLSCDDRYATPLRRPMSLPTPDAAAAGHRHASSAYGKCGRRFRYDSLIRHVAITRAKALLIELCRRLRYARCCAMRYAQSRCRYLLCHTLLIITLRRYAEMLMLLI